MRNSFRIKQNKITDRIPNKKGSKKEVKPIGKKEKSPAKTR